MFTPNLNKRSLRYCACVNDSAHIQAVAVEFSASGDILILFILEKKKFKKIVLKINGVRDNSN